MFKFPLFVLLFSLATVQFYGINGQRPRTTTSRVPIRTTPPPQPTNFNLTFVVSSKDLPAKTKTTKLNPYVVISYRNSSSPKDTWTELGKTDQLSNTDLNPDWSRNVFWFVWTKGTGQVWHFEIKDHHTLSKDSVIGSVDIDVDDYVLKKSQDTSVTFSSGGVLFVKKTVPFYFTLYARSLPNKDSLGAGISDPFVECFWKKGKDSKDEILFYTTPVIDNVENPDWKDRIEFSNYQKGANQWFHFKVWDKDPATSNDLLGEGLLEIDPFVEKRALKNIKLSTDSANKGTLSVAPA